MDNWSNFLLNQAVNQSALIIDTSNKTINIIEGFDPHEQGEVITLVNIPEIKEFGHVRIEQIGNDAQLYINDQLITLLNINAKNLHAQRFNFDAN